MKTRGAGRRSLGWAAILCFLIIAAMPVLASDQPSLPGIIGHDDRRMLDSKNWPWTAIGRINMQGTSFCTGALVAADQVLTAAHCLLNKATGRLHRPDFLTFAAGYDRGQYKAVGHVKSYKTPCTPILPLPDKLGAMDCDIALLQLTEPITDPKPLPMAKEALEEQASQNGTLLLAGYQQDRPYMLSIDERCRLLKWVGKGVFLHSCDGVKGASGAPVISRVGDQFMIIGVHLGFVRLSAASVNTTAGVGTAWPSPDFPQ